MEYKKIKDAIFEEVYKRVRDDDLTLDDLNLAAIIVFNLNDEVEDAIITKDNKKEG